MLLNKLPNSNSGANGSKKSTFPVVGRLGCNWLTWRLENSKDGWCKSGGFKLGAGICGTVCCNDNPITLTPLTWPREESSFLESYNS